MPNNWFQFKQFIIYQEKSAMKVGTDGVLLGAWSEVPRQGKILDIGTGTGLIALMMAQKSKAEIVALEPESDSFQQAKENIDRSEWSNRIIIHPHTLQTYADSTKERFDLIITNPPFHDESVKSPSLKREIVRHSDSLPLSVLIENIAFLLKPDGFSSLIYPYDKLAEIESLSKEQGLFINKKTRIIPSPGKKPHRVLLQLTKKFKPCIETEILIETGIRHHYSDDFKQLLSPFYLHFKY